jgi:Clp protease
MCSPLRVAAAAAVMVLGWAGHAGAMDFRVVPLREPGKVALLLQGAIEATDADRLKKFRLPAGQQIALVVLNSPGGAVLAGRDMARFLRTRGVPVMVPKNGVCASACFLLFAAATTKIAEPGARIGVHSASVSGGRENTDTLGITTLMAREAAAYGVPPAITGRMVTTKPGDMAWLTPDELRLMGVQIKGDVAPAGVGAPGAATVSDWSLGFTFGTAHAAEPCNPPDGVANAADWRIGCKSGQTSTAQTGAPAQARPSSAAPAPSAGESDWSRGFSDGMRAACGTPPAGVANAGDYALGCGSGRKAAGGN